MFTSLKRSFVRLFSAWSIRTQLLILLIVALLPALVILLMSGLELQQRAIRRAKTDALVLIGDLSEQHERFVIATHQLLSTLADLPDVQSRNPKGCTEIFDRLRQQNPRYSIILASNAEGNIFASSPLRTTSVSFAHRKFFKEAIRTKNFAAGEYVVSQIAKRPTFHFAMPVLDEKGQLLSVVVAGMDLTGVDRFFTASGLPKNSSLLLLDHKGVVLHQINEPDETLGAAYPLDRFLSMTGMQQEGYFLERGLAGKQHFCAYRQLRLREEDAPYMYVAIRVPELEVLAEPAAILHRNLLMTGIVALLAAVVVWFLGGVTIVEPTRRLVAASHRLGRGELGSQVGLDCSCKEFVELAHSFDEASLALATEELERTKAQKAVAASEERFRQLVELAVDGIFEGTPDGVIIGANTCGCNMTGYSQQELIGKNIRELFTKESLASSPLRYDLLNHGLTVTNERTLLRKDGSLLPIEMNSRRMPDGTYQSFMRDITERKRAEERLKQSHQQLRALSARVQLSREEERTHIAREIHDHLGQLLTGLKMDLHALQRRISTMPGSPLQEALSGKISAATELADETVKSVQKIAMELRPGILDRLGLVAAVEAESQAFQSRTGLRCEWSVPDGSIDISPEHATTAYRIFQEILTNVARHAKATHVNVRLSCESGQLLLEVRDDGVGIRPEDLEDPKSLGLLGMQERASLLGGTIDFKGESGKGTTVRLQVPLAGKSSPAA